ncbi:hypothetical protein SMACR_04635 [Sordaria macrospora]|uniref:WGS project CABT00000000 data, contig 2.20 n=2 Tax=Sordaria macrospora TaxID=5147 RepID=F7W216_SORMK|nr:uncharacterized protein SMAC_04635 [Sordaria macrospora k-hell]KAA8636068.1 hypothetical protein SMACR_04635 [Sordaria macrospora]KAH7634785.1 hypothetical protein B0T09DRAFT_255402 [Sordaria sp. MPI-SDFR-AT-0083]WPJ58439.1 hypothetical protein SMAC4_04635 [Sordaria macrospora]CCC11653.1 unnamed protein product [Sordaria macrospora k-hell]
MIPRPEFFLVRPDTEILRNDTGAIQREQGPMVPLIAVDELPDWIDIGLPRELTVEQTMGLYNLGMVSHNGDTYRVRIIEPNSQEEFVWKRAGESSKATLVSSGVCAPPRQRTMAHPEQQSQRVPYHSSTASTGRDPRSIHYPSAAEPCTHPAHPNVAAASSNPNRLTRAKDEHSVRWADLVERSMARDTEAAHGPRRHSTLLAPPPSPQIPPHSHPTVHRDAMTPDRRASIPHSILAAPPHTTNTNVNIDTATPTTNTAPVSAANPANPGEYCRHWCQHGTCKWGTFCRHKHAMPTTLEGLLEVGLFEIPAWWISATGIGMSSNKTKQNAAAAVAASPTNPACGNGGGTSGAGSGAPPPPISCTPMTHGHNNLHHHMLPAIMGTGAGVGVGASSAKKLSNRKLKAQQREFNQRLRLLSSMLIPPGYGGPLRHPADALLMHGMSGMPGYGSSAAPGPGQHQLLQQQIQQIQQHQHQQQKFERERERERKGEKTPLDRSHKNVKVTFNEDGTVSLVTAGGGSAAAGQGQGQAGSASTSGPAGVAAGASSTDVSSSTTETGKPSASAGDGGGATDETDRRRENDTKPVKGLANSMHAPKQQDQQGQVVVTIPPPGNNMSKKATCEDENEGGGNGAGSSAVQQLADIVPLLVEI